MRADTDSTTEGLDRTAGDVRWDWRIFRYSSLQDEYYIASVWVPQLLGAGSAHWEAALPASESFTFT